jgi:hypothetical protein
MSVGQDIGSIQLLKEYETRRYYSNLSMLSIVDTLNTIFSIGKEMDIEKYVLDNNLSLYLYFYHKNI